MSSSRVVLYSLLAAGLAAAFYFNSNADTIYAQLGNRYYKQNNIKKAQEFYEKSFALGNKDTGVREIYVNSIINSPLDIDAQEKLVRLAEDNIQDAASIKAKYFLYDLKREIHRQYPLNYIKQAPFNQQIVRWNKFPITYGFKNSAGVPREFVNEISSAFSEWEREGNVMFSETEENPNIVINFVKNNKNESMEYGKKYVVAYTEPKISGDILEGMNINFYIQDPEGKNFTRNQIYNTALHEIFHALGFMGHSFDPDNIMYLAKDNNAIANDTRESLTGADTSTLQLLYKIKPDVTNSSVLKSEYVPYLVLGDDEELNSSKAREAKNYIYHAPTLPSGYIDLAESLVAEKRYPEAIRNLEKALSLADTDDMRYIIYYNLAVSYSYISHTEMAVDYLSKAMEIQNNEELHLLKAEILKNTDKETAKKEYAYLIKISPDNPDYTTKLANMYIKEYDYLKARKILKDFLKRNPQYNKDARFSPYGILLF